MGKESRFIAKDYLDVLNDPMKRRAVAKQEKPYCRLFGLLPQSTLGAFFIVVPLSLCGASPFLLSIAFGWGPVLTLSLVFVIWVVPALSFLFLLFRRAHKAKACLMHRNPLKIEDFCNKSDRLKYYKADVVRAVRETLGFVHCIESSKIYPSDTLSFLCFGSGQQTPYRFEVILGVTKRLEISISDTEVDHISEKLYRNARHVVDVVTILADSIKTA